MAEPFDGESEAGPSDAERWRRARALILAGTLVLAVQDAVLFGAFLWYLGAIGRTAFDVRTTSLVLDLPGIVLLAAGILTLRLREFERQEELPQAL